MKGECDLIHIDIQAEHFTSLLDQHKLYLEDIIKQRYSNMQSSFNSKERIFFETYLGKDMDVACSKLLELCTSPDLEKLVIEFENLFSLQYKKDFKREIHKRIKLEHSEAKQISKILDDILGYIAFNDGSSLWNRHTFISALNVKVCPYCNRNYITSYLGDKTTTTADADHYYPKSLYPILQMNLYNMIPSCNVCNSKMKLDKDKRHLYPYIDSSECLKFTAKMETLQQLYNYSKDDAEIIVSAHLEEERALNSISIFRLDKIYGIHNDVIFDLKNKIYAYQALQESYYSKMLGEDLCKELFNMIDIHSYWFDFLYKDPLDEPLVKLKQDIYKQFVL